LSVGPIIAWPYQGRTITVRSSPAGTRNAASPTSRSSVEMQMWAPRLGAIRGISSSVRISSGRIVSAQTPVALITFAARSSSFSPDSASVKRTPAARPPSSRTSVASAPFRSTAPNRSASPRIVSTSRESSVWQS
jgi:hypothetical protein